MPQRQENKGLQSAIQKIEEAQRTNATDLSLEGMGLAAIPDSVAELSQLQKLDCAHNDITAIPDWVANLYQLQTLNLRANLIADIPNSIVQLPELRQLNIARNQITIIPDSIAGLTRLQKLDLYDNRIEKVPDSLAQLTELLHLDLSYNRIAELWHAVIQLPKLERLRLGNNRISEIPDSISQLCQLQRLNMRGNLISVIPHAIAKLTRLKAISLIGNQITNIPGFITQLFYLEYLHLSNNSISVIPEFIGQLSSLQELGLSGNQISDIPESISQLSQLWKLLLGRNQITTIPNSLAQLPLLQHLDLSDNQISAVPEQLVHLENLRILFLHGNPGLGVPVEILGPDASEVESGQKEPKSPQEILSYLTRATDSRPLNEAKLILLGHGEVGKTSLVTALSTGKFRKGEKTTEGIKISDWECHLDKKNKVMVHIWDFGGQEMMHATHQFFLTQRSLYLLVLNRRRGGVDREADYWFRLVRAFGGRDAPVIVVLNKQESEPFDVNREGWLEKYPNIKGFVSTDCENKRTITQLKRKIVERLQAMSSLKARFPRRWFAIKDALSQMVAEHISFDDYRKICELNGENDAASQASLAGFLHDLGIALNYRHDPRLRFNYILKPEWVTQGIYALLHAFIRQKGVFTLTQAESELAKKKYSAEDTHFLLGLMERFELSFSLDDRHNRVLIPELLDDKQPKEAAVFNPKECLNFGYKYSVLPEGLMPRFIARTHHLGKPENRWKSGVILQDIETGCRALVRADAPDAEVRVHIEGPKDARRELLGIIRYNFDVIHSDYESKPEALVYSPAAPQKSLSVDELEALARSKATTIPLVLPNKSVVNQDIASLIDPLTTHPPIKLFLSYSHQDEKSINELRKDLRLMEMNGLVRPWYDRALAASDQWEASILQELNTADIVICQLSRDYFFSDYCVKELRAAIERRLAGNGILIAYVLTDCGWKEFPGLAEFQLLPTDGKPLSDWSDPNKYWRAVIHGIQKSIKNFQAGERSHAVRGNAR